MTSNEKSSFFTNRSYQLYDSETMPFKNQTISHFALTDSLLKYVGQHQITVAHFWPTTDLVILGMLDTKLPYLADALDKIKEHRHRYIVRNSGGLAVVGDEGVLNFSLILPETPDNRISINEGYDRMLYLIRALFQDEDAEINAYEISESYCPGEYDLSISGKKFAGISQRRLKNGVAVMIYISVNGNQTGRSEMLRDFYEAGLQDATVKWRFPKVNPAVMGTLEELLGKPLAVSDLKEKIIHFLTLNHSKVTNGIYTDDIFDAYQESYRKMIQRNVQMLEDRLEKELLE